MSQIQAENGPLCQKLHALGLDLFKKAQIEMGIDDLAEDKLRNITICEKKRLHRFANEFPHEQHLLNLQSLLIASLIKLARLLANQTTSISEFRCQLARIAVLVHEVDVEVAKAKLHKRNGFAFNQQAVKEAEEAIKLAANKKKEVNSDHKAQQLHEWQLRQNQLKLQDQAKNLQAQMEMEMDPETQQAVFTKALTKLKFKL